VQKSPAWVSSVLASSKKNKNYPSEIRVGLDRRFEDAVDLAANTTVKQSEKRKNRSSH